MSQLDDYTKQSCAKPIKVKTEKVKTERSKELEVAPETEFMSPYMVVRREWESMVENDQSGINSTETRSTSEPANILKR